MPGESIPQGLWLPPRAATLFVAASDALDRSRAQADYICDGVADEVEIEQAIAALPAQGGTIQLLEGTYNIAATININTSNVVLRGNGRSTTIFLTNNSDCIMIQIGDGASGNISGVEIRDMELDGNDANQGAGAWHGIYLLGAAGNVVSHCIIDNCYIHDAKDDGINTNTVYEDDIRVLNCEISACVDVGVFFGAAGEGAVVSKNYIHDNGDEGLWTVSIRALVSENIFSANGEADIHVSGTYTVITSNVIRDSVDWGILVASGTDILIVGNTIFNTGDEGIYATNASYCVITGNHVYDTSKEGIKISQSNYCTVSGNVVNGAQQEGISLRGYGITCTGNAVYNSGTNGIYTYQAYHAVISSNTCACSGLSGIHLWDSDHCDVIGNTIYDNSEDADNTSPGIDLNTTNTYCLIQANVVRKAAAGNQQNYGVNIAAGNTHNIVKDNDLHDSGKTAAINDAGTLTHIENNRGEEITDIKVYRNVKNTSGGAFAIGDVVSLKAVAAGNEITTPGGIGERQVYGMVAEAIADTAYGYVQVKGFTAVLKATNVGGGAIIIGDFLITEAGVRARKCAANTDPIFARALEDGNAADLVLDAFIVSPWD